MKRQQTAWDKLSIGDKASYIGRSVSNGIYELSKIREEYNKFDEGGNLNDVNIFAKKGRMSRVGETGGSGEGDEEVRQRNGIGRFIGSSGYNQGLRSVSITPRESFWSRLASGLADSRDARIGAVGAQQVRDLYNEDNDDLAKDLAQKYTLSNAAGIAIGGGAQTLIANPVLARTVDIIGNIDGARNLIANNGFGKVGEYWDDGRKGRAALQAVENILDLVGIGDTARLVKNFATPAYRAYHAYNTITPYSYDQPFKRGKDWFNSMLLEKRYNKPIWETDMPMLAKQMAFEGDPAGLSKYYAKTRQDAWRIYLGMQPQNGTYIKNADGTYSYSLDKMADAYSNADGVLLWNIMENTKNQKHDFIGQSHGGLWEAKSTKIDEIKDGHDTYSFENIRIGDRWDLNPFERQGDRLISDRINSKIGQAGFNYFNHKGNVWAANKFNNVIDKVLNNKLTNTFDDKIAKFEVGKLLGGKPFYMQTDIPYTVKTSIKLDNFMNMSPDFYESSISFGRNIPEGYLDPALLFDNQLILNQNNFKKINSGDLISIGGHRKFDTGGEVITENSSNELSNGEITQVNPFNAWDKFVANNPRVAQRLRKDGVLSVDLGRVLPYTGLIMDAYDLLSGNPRPDSFKETLENTTNALGFSGRALNFLYGMPFAKIGETEVADAFNRVSKILQVPDIVSDSVKFIKDFATPIEQFAYGSPLVHPFSKTPIPAVRYAGGGFKDSLMKLFAPKYTQEKFGDAFAAARSDGQRYFRWNGNRYNTNTKEQQQMMENTIDWSGIQTTGGRRYNADYINYINNSLEKSGIDSLHRSAILGNIIEESGGDPFAIDSTKTYSGLLQWGPDRYVIGDEKDPYREIDNQLAYFLSTQGNLTDKKSWTHGGKGSGYNSLKDAYNRYSTADNLEDVMHALTWGYVRPAGKQDSYNNRLRVAQQVYDRYNKQ